MDLQRLENIIGEHGVPSTEDDIIRIVREARGVDVSAIVTPPRQGSVRRRESATITSFQDTTNLRGAYTEYRQRMRMSTPGFSFAGDYLASIYRTSSPRGNVVDYASSISIDIRRKIHQLGVESVPMPIVLDQNTPNRIDYDPQPIGERHIRIQIPHHGAQCNYDYRIINGDREGYYYNNVLLGASLGTERNYSWSVPVTEIVNRLRLEGWDIHNLLRITQDGTFDIPFCATRPQNVDPEGTQLVVFGTSKRIGDRSSIAGMLAAALKILSARWNDSQPEPEDRSGPTEDDIQLARDLMQVRTIAAATNQRISILQGNVMAYRTAADTATQQLATALRNLEDESRELEVLNSNIAGQIIERYRAMSTVADDIVQLRPVESAEVVEQGSTMILKVTTHKYGMRRANGSALEIPKLLWEIDMMNDHFQHGTKMFRAEGTGRVVHPHATGSGERPNGFSICWGNAARTLAEAWARRDWTSFVRVILGWQTQYNGSSPYNSWSTLREYLPVAPRRGWITPEDEQQAQQGQTLGDNEVEDAVVVEEEEVGQLSASNFHNTEFATTEFATVNINI